MEVGDIMQEKSIYLKVVQYQADHCEGKTFELIRKPHITTLKQNSNHDPRIS